MSSTLNEWAVSETIRIELKNFPTLASALSRYDFFVDGVVRAIKEDLEQDGRNEDDWSDADIMRFVGYELEMYMDLARSIMNEQRRQNKYAKLGNNKSKNHWTL